MEVRFYETPAGSRPVQKYLATLSDRERAAVAESLTAIERDGFKAAGVEFRQVRGKLWEVKASQQRLFYVVIEGPVMVLLEAVKKQGRRARPQDIAVAEKRMREALSG